MQLTVKEVAGVLNVSEKTVYRWVSKGQIPAYRIQDQFRFSRGELLEWAMLQRLNVSPELLMEPESVGKGLPGLVQAIRNGGILYRLEGGDRETVLRNAAQSLPVADDVDRNFVFKALLAREVLSSTAIGDGIATPHARTPMYFHAFRPSIAVLFLEKEIEYGSLDGTPVSALLVLLGTSLREQYHLQSLVHFALRDRRFKRCIQNQELREKIISAAGLVDEQLNFSGSDGAGGSHAIDHR